MSKFSGFTLIIPTVSTGNVPQLTTDLLIHNYSFQFQSVLDSTLLYPFASPIDYTIKSTPGTSTGLELHVAEDLKAAIVVQRSPVIPQYTRNFVDYLLHQVIESNGFKNVIVLDSHEAVLAVTDPSKRVKIYSDDESLIAGVEKLKLNYGSLEQRTTDALERLQDEMEQDRRFSDFAKELIDIVSPSSNITALVIDVYEGDNSFDAQILGQAVTKALSLPENSMNIKPKSWGGVYGDRPIPLGIEGGLFT